MKHSINCIMFILLDVSERFKVKKYCLLKTLLRDKYGQFEIISETNKSFIILFQTM